MLLLLVVRIVFNDTVTHTSKIFNIIYWHQYQVAVSTVNLPGISRDQQERFAAVGQLLSETPRTSTDTRSPHH